MAGKLVQFDDETWQAIEAVMARNGLGFQEITGRRAQEVQSRDRAYG
jgi:hypothetical protein